MKVKLKCKDCGATGWGRGVDEDDVNATVVTDYPDEWDGGKPECSHECEMEVIDSEFDDCDV